MVVCACPSPVRLPWHQTKEYAAHNRGLPLPHTPQVKCLRVLQYFPPPEEPSVRRMLVEVVKRILGGEGRGRA